MAYQVRKIAAPHTLEHRVYIEKDGVPVSPFHDIPLYANAEQTVLNMIVEIPRWTNAKLEVSAMVLVVVVLLEPRIFCHLAFAKLDSTSVLEVVFDVVRGGRRPIC